MAPHRLTLTGPAKNRPPAVAGITLIVLGLACFVVGLAFDGGFVRGLFNGATIALMLLGAYVVGAGRKHRRTEGAHDGGHWLPSRDNSSDRAGR